MVRTLQSHVCGRSLTGARGSSSYTHGRSPQYNSKPCKCPSLRCCYNWPPCTLHFLGEVQAIHCKCPCALVRFPEDLFMMFTLKLSWLRSNGSAQCRLWWGLRGRSCMRSPCLYFTKLIWVLYRNLKLCSATSSLASRAVSRCLLRLLQVLLLLQVSADWCLDMVTCCLPLRADCWTEVPEHRPCYHQL